MRKKGFTLIELIAVIAILAILGAVLVPRIVGYKNKANKSNVLTSARIIVHAIQAYNADASPRVAGVVTQGEQMIDTDTVGAAIPIVNAALGASGSVINTTKADYTNLAILTLQELLNVSKGSFTYQAGVLGAGDVTIIAGSTILD